MAPSPFPRVSLPSPRQGDYFKTLASGALIPAVPLVKFLSAHVDRNGTKNREEHLDDLFALMELGGR